MKKKYIKNLYLILIGLIALKFGVPLIAIVSITFITFWLCYVYWAIKKAPILSKKEKRICHLCFFILALLTLTTIRNFKEVLVLLGIMIIRNDIAVLIWFKAGKGFLETAIAHTATSLIGIMMIYLTTDLFKSHAQPRVTKILTPLLTPIKNWIIIQHIINLFRLIKNRLSFLKHSLIQWLKNKETIWLFLIYLIPIPIPYFSTIITIIFRYRNIRYGLWILLTGGILKEVSFVWLAWQGLIRVSS